MVSGSKSLQKFRLKNRKVCDSDKRRGRNCDIISDTGASSLFLILFKDTPSQPIPGIGLVLWSSKYLNSPFTLLILLIDTTHQRFPAASTLTMGKIDQKQTKKRSCKATCKSKHKATDGDSEHKKQPSLAQRSLKLLMMMAIDTLIGATNSGNCAISRCNLATALYHKNMLTTPCSGGGFRLSAPPLGYIRTERQIACDRSAFEHSMVLVIRALDGIGFEWGTSWNAKRNSVTAMYHNNMLPTPNSVI
jgi:hypothetical protein